MRKAPCRKACAIIDSHIPREYLSAAFSETCDGLAIKVATVIRDFCPPEDSFVFTNVLDAKALGDKACFRRIERLAKQLQAGFFPVWLTCNADVIRQRKNTPERRARLKDIDLTDIKWWIEEFEVLRVQHANALTLDTSHAEPGQTAQRILEHVQATNLKLAQAQPTARSLP